MEEFERLEWCCVPCTGGGVASMEVFKDFKAYLRHVAERSIRRAMDIFGTYGMKTSLGIRLCTSRGREITRARLTFCAV